MKNVEDIYPLSPLQKGMLFHSLLAPESGVYVSQFTCTLPEDLDPRRFRQAWESLVTRHGILRTAFLWDGLDEPLQVVRKKVSLPWQDLDWSGLPAHEQKRRLEELRQSERHSPPALSKAPLLRFSLIRLDRELSFLWTFHHLLMDGWSLPLLVQELESAYAALLEGREPEQPPVRPFSDYIVWLQRQDLSRAEPFWREELAGFAATTPLGLDRPAGAAGAPGYAEHEVLVSREVTAALQALANRHKLTLQTVTLGAWGVLLSRYGGEEDVVFGNVVSGRPAALPGVETMIGMFINTLPVRVRASDSEPLAPWLQRLQERQLARREFEHTQLSQIQRWSEVPAGSPLFETLYVFENYPPAQGGGLGALRIGNLRSFETTNYPLTLILRGGDRIPLRLVYDRTRAEDAPAQRLLHHCATLLSGMAEGPERRLGELSLFTAEEIQQLRIWNGAASGSSYPFARPLSARIEEQADRAPGAVAVTCEGEEVTYRELDDRANRLALHLRALGVGPEAHVAILMARSIDLVVALLAVLKAGGAYVPIDPAYPAERIAFLLADSAASVLVTEAARAAVLSATEIRIVRIDEDRDRIGALPAERLAAAGEPESLAYVIYTSGSTGRPKGVQVTHANVARLFAATEERFSFGPGDVWTFFHSVAFDFSVWEIWGALLHGGRLVVVPYETSRSPGLFLDLLIREGITVLNQTPSAFAQLAQIDQERGGVSTELRLVIFGGEALDPTRLAPWFARHGDEKPRLVNMYGITETTVHVTYRPLVAADAAVERQSFIGGPLPDLSLVVMDPVLRPAPLGVPGELMIGGAGLARGYLGRPELSAERFVPDPDGGGPGARLYRSGDRGRRLANGEVEYLGRIDHQVKIRGFRIELGEIEAALLAQPGVREAIVVAREERPGDRRLVAYVTGDATADALRRSLRERLPDYMIPAAFVALAALPLTGNGKVDRKALPAPERQGTEESFLAPRTPVEEILAGIWAELLGLERVGATGHFFDLGGHSLLATQVISRLRGAFQIEMPLRDLFEAPTLADLAARVEDARRAGTGTLAPPLVPVPRQGPLPLSFAQQRLWFIDQLEPGTPLYNMPVTLRVEGPLKPETLKLCLGEIVRRHEALRTAFVAWEGSPAQVIRASAPLALPKVDLSGLPESAAEVSAFRLADEEARRPFDLARGPLLRCLLLRLAEEDHVVALTMHHIASDGWSMGILVREVAALYAAFAEAEPSPLAELPVQYADFSVWQNSWLHGEVLEGEISFWRRQLADLPPLLELPTDRPRPAVQSFRGSSRTVRLPADLARRIGELSRREGVTRFMVLLAGFHALLAGQSGQRDLAVGSPVAGRNRVEIEGVIGFFVNTLVMRADLTGEPSFRQLLGQVRETALAAHAHQDVPFERLVQEISPERSLAHTPLFQVMFVLQNTPVESLDIRNLRLRPAGAARTTAKFDLTLSLEEGSGTLSGAVEYATDLFDPTTVQRLVGRFERLLEVAMSDTDLGSVADLPLLSLAEAHQVRIEWNPTAAAPGTSVVGRFEGWADRTPDAAAVLAPGETLTYGGLDRRANQLARHLRALGVTLDSQVGLCVERSPGMIVAVMAILKAGAAYVPLDPAYPREHLAFMIEDARVPVLITEERLLGSLPEMAAVTLRLDTDWHAVSRESDGRLPEVATPDSLAYTIYTSGSTGRPKGVMVPHRGWANLAEAQRRLFGLGPGSRVLQFASLSFDASAWEIAMALGAGAALVLGPRERRLSAEELTALLQESTIATLPPTALATLAPEDLAGPETLVVAGEACLPGFARRWWTGRRFFNAYGPTEASVCATAKLYDGGESLPIGRPIDRVQAYVLDFRGNPVPVGVAGELCLGGPGLARGYLNLPEKTAWSFVPHPLATVPGERLYRTGDLSYRLPDGEIEILGRTDHQVKVRGFRIELGEIEQALVALAGVREAVVVAREDRSDPAPGARRLVAYLVGDASAETLRRSLRERLPDFMVPAAFVTLAALPLTPNGKIDPQALPSPDWQGTLQSYVAPRTPVGEILAGIWAELLGLERVGGADHFFDLGGHSLLATQVMSRLRGAFDIEMPLRALFEAPVLSDLAARVEAEIRTGAGGRSTPPLVPVLREGPLPLSFAQQRLWFIDRLDPGKALYNIPVALRVAGPLDSRVLALSLGEIVRRHEVLRTVFATFKGSPSQEIQPVAPFGLPLIDLSGLPETEREATASALTDAEANRPFDLAHGPLLRGVLLRLAAEDHIATLTMHHIASDGWSMGILVREVAALYTAFAQGRPSPLPELPIQFADFASWQRGWLQGEVLEEQLAWWRAELADAPDLLRLPTDRPRPLVQSGRGAVRPLRFPTGLTEEVQALGRHRGATTFMVLLAGFQALLARHAAQLDLLVGSPIANRNRTEVEGLIGLFVNTLVLRGRLDDRLTFRELLTRARTTALGAYAHQDLPFEKLVEEMRVPRNLGHNPIVQVLLQLQNAPIGILTLPGLTLAPVASGEAAAKLDLSLALGEADGALEGSLVYAADLFDATTAERLAEGLGTLLAGAVANPDLPLPDLAILAAPERHQLLEEWNDTAAPRPAGAVLHQLFATLVARMPQAPAVVFEGRTLTYAQLDRSTDRLAHRLRNLGVGPDAVVGVLMERSAEMVVALLGILKAGAAYLPLDPELPSERIAGMIEGASGPVLLAQERLLPVLPPVEAQILLLEEGWEGSGADDDVTALPRVGDESLAYVLYTSGSTGKPKGVMIPHRGIVNRLLWMQEAYALAPGDRVLQKTPFSFDVSVWEFFWPLITGSCLVVARPGGHRDGAYLAGLIERERVTVTHFVPSMLQVFLDLPELSACAGLRLVVASGEALSPEVRRRCRERLPARLENLYGPTEASVDVTAWNCAESARGGVVPIGRPVANTRIHLLDRSFRLAPIGLAGELCIGGVQLARGYLSRPDLTAERFVPDPCGGAAGGRLYRTGDLARHLPDGAVEFLGRVDHQVKLRGFRIELGEIEAALCVHPDVREAAVLLRGEGADRSLVAYVAPDDASPATLRAFLRARLPEPMVPAFWVALSALPLSPNGKLDRRALGRMEPVPAEQRQERGSIGPHGRVEQTVAAIWCEVLGIGQVGRDESFFDVGGHSLLLVRVQARLAEELGREVSLVDLFRYPTVSALAGFLEPEGAILVPSPRSRPLAPEPRRIAIVGMAGRFPGASGVEAFWQNLCAGVESISFYTDADLEAAGVDPATRSSPHFVPAGGVLDGIELFDAGFFGYTPRDAEITDPQHRLFLECAWEALESAGYAPEGCPGPVGVFAGVSRSSYVWNLISNPEVLQAAGSFRIAIGTDKDSLSTNVSYKLDLTGPSLSIQTACSTSLVAVHVACRSLLAGECDMALAGGASITVPQCSGYLYREGGIGSPDGHCRAFDARAQGAVGGSGVGVVVLKRLEEALADGDPIHAVILGSAINNDGAAKVGYTAPGVAGQAGAIRAALEASGIDPRTIGYVETHGTGTPLGDPIEIAALTQAFRDAGCGEGGSCSLGSVKTNIGHLDAAAGVAGLIKAVLTVERGLIPPSLHFESPNPAIDFANGPFRVNDRLQEWRTDGGPRRAGISSFGIGGTNAHAILEEAPPSEPSGPSRRHQVLLLSARTPAALDEATRNLADHLAAHPDTNLPDVAWTLQVGRRAFGHRRVVVCDSLPEAVGGLSDPAGSGRVLTRDPEPGGSGVAFLFPGQGAQTPGMGRELYEQEPVFRAEIDACAERLLPLLGRDLRKLLFPAAEGREEAARELRQTRFAQPALFAYELALARLWTSWGIRPQAMIGHSLGEYVAACLAGVFSPEDALELVAARGELMQEMPSGAMLSVELSEGELAVELAALPELSLAVVNAPSRCVASGPETAVALLEQRLAERGVRTRRLATSHAFHSAMMDPALATFAERVARIARKPPAIPFISNLTGTWITAEQATDPGYWVRHLRETVRFASGIATLLSGPYAALLEVGPGSALADLARRQSGPAGRPVPISSLRSGGTAEPDSATLVGTLGRLWLAGAEIDWRAFHTGERRLRVPLPTYPFERQWFWVEASRRRSAAIPEADRRRFVVAGGGETEEPLTQTLQAGGHEVERASGADLGGLLTDPRSIEALQRLLALEPGLRVILPLAPKNEAAPGPTATLTAHRRPDLPIAWQAPESDVERRLAAAWQELLGIAEIGVHDDFFELGGHSLVATQVISRVREAFGLELPIDSLHDTPTLAGLAARIEAGHTTGESAPPLVPVARSGPLPVSFAQQRLLFLQLLSPADAAYNLPLGLRLTGPLDRAALAEALRRLEGRHEALRTTFSVDEERVSQVVSPIAETGDLPSIDLTALPRSTAEDAGRRIATEDAALPFDLLRGPIWRARLVRLAPEEHALTLTVHHVAADGWSNGILFRETVDLYEALVERRRPDLPELPIQYADFAAWQRSWLCGEALERLLTYWKIRLDKLPSLDLPTDRPRPPVRTGQGDVRYSRVSAEPIEALRRIARQEDATLFMALAVGFSLLLRRDTGSDDIVLGTDIANRTRRETEGLVGLFVNQIVLRHDLSGDPSFRELLRRVRRLTLEAYAHQDAPFDKLVEALNPPRDPSRTPLFQVKLVLQNTPAEARRLRGLTVSSLELDNRTAKFDLLLNLTENASGLICALEYASDLYEPTTVDRLLESFAAVLRTVAEQPEAPLCEIDRILGQRDHQQQEERARGRRSEAVLRARHRRTLAEVR